MKRLLKRLFPVVCITIVTILISIGIINKIMSHEQSRAWMELTTTGQTISDEIKTKFQDEIVKLHLVESMMQDSDDEGSEILYLKVIQPTTMFARIDVLYPDGTIYSNDETIRTEKDIDFDSLATKGEYMTQRKTDYITGKECVYYVLPVMRGENIRAVLIGMMDMEALSEAFQPVIYNGLANIQIIDTKDGNYILDSWHTTLGNAYENGERTKAKGYEDFDMRQALVEQRTGTVAFYSKTTGRTLYMYLTPVGMFDWELSIFAPEDVLFSEVIHMRRLFLYAGIMEVLLLLAYFGLNIRTVRLLEGSLAENERQKEALRRLSYFDGLTALYNRNKYVEMVKQFAEQTRQNIGVAYVDLNGLKQINDAQSHTAGDDYIRRAAQTLGAAFAEQCYRLGGDEFLVVVTNVTHDDFAERIAQAREKMESEGISVSIGMAWQAESSTLDEMLKAAEQKMYQEKEKYYRTHDRRR